MRLFGLSLAKLDKALELRRLSSSSKTYSSINLSGSLTIQNLLTYYLLMSYDITLPVLFGFATEGSWVNIYGTACSILNEPNPAIKARKTIEFATSVISTSQMLPDITPFLVSGVTEIPLQPMRSESPKLVSPLDHPSARECGVSPLVWLLHSIARTVFLELRVFEACPVHLPTPFLDIEINAVELTWDTILRFHNLNLPSQFVFDFLSIANDEARHYELLCRRLDYHGSYYGHIPAHGGLWNAAEKTKSDLLGRLGSIQLVQEPRALDSAERLAKKMVSYGDVKSAKLLELICSEEINHVRIGVKWFEYFCSLQGADPIPTFHDKVKQYVGLVPPPFNEVSRAAANMGSEWYLPISQQGRHMKKSEAKDTLGSIE